MFTLPQILEACYDNRDPMKANSSVNKCSWQCLTSRERDRNYTKEINKKRGREKKKGNERDAALGVSFQFILSI